MDAMRELEEVYADFLAIISTELSLLSSLFDTIDPSGMKRSDIDA